MLGFALLLAACANSGAAQVADAPGVSSAQSTSSISGRVQNEVTGQYLNNARVTLKGSNLTAFTDETGMYRLAGVPSGTAVLEVYYTGLDPREITLQVAPARSLEQDVGLGNKQRYGGPGEVVKLDQFVVSMAKLTEGEALAINEQRFAPNLKNVIATDAFGDISEGNIAEFMKFMPGISVEYEGDAPTTISVRGFNPSMTTVLVDGAQNANAVRVGESREFHFKQVSINDTSRIEVTKVPTPSTPASTMAGSINLVSKSAFERDRKLFNYSVYLGGNNRTFSLTREPHSREERVYKVVPNFNFDYTLPLTKNLGIIVTGLTSIQHAANSYDTMNFNPAAAAGASLARPVLASYSVVDFASFHNRYSLSLKVDWRPTPNSVLSVSGRTTYYQDFNGNNTMVFTAGTNAVPVPATGVRMTFGDNFTIGATGRGGVTMSNNHSNIQGAMTAGSARYRLNKGDWRVEAGFDHSKSRTWRRYLQFGNFRGLNVALLNPVRVSLLDFDSMRPDRVEVFDNNNAPVDYTNIRNFRLTGATTNSTGDVRERIVSGDFSVRREFTAFELPLAIQVGGRQQSQTRGKKILNADWTYASPDADPTPARFLSQVYAGYKQYPGVGPLPWTSPKLAYDAWEQNPAIFTQTAAQRVAQEQFRLTNSEFIQEKTEAYYFQADTRVLKNRLRILTGVRFEKTTDDGLGALVEPSAVFVRNADGSFAHNAAGARIRRPEAGAAGSLQELQLTTHERAATSFRTYDGYYPSLHLTFNATEQFQVRAAYARTFGRPDFSSIVPGATITEFDDINGDPSAIGGTIAVQNPALRPWTADNYDLSLEYYTRHGGVFSAGVFFKEIEDFFGDVVKNATAADLQELGLDPQYVGWTLSTKFNSGDARVTGGEASVRHSLLPLGAWGRPFAVFANVTKLRLEGNQGANFTGFMPFAANWGVNFNKSRVSASLNWSHRGKQKLLPNPASGPDGYTYWKARTTVDVNLGYQLSKRLSLFASARNLLNVKPVFMRYGSETPEYARVNRTENYGVKFSLGIKGSL